ncbi:unnamed protein product [Protopolystoma xenopodis]|uniref:Uncharacterized protein n=1 Tax=Protopolystoma xenopodis TaxID=117903 RepID=A0A448WKJ9_9PLAT|nr:unnamed protein product [Protopolystoma xenopodis]
MWSKSTLGLEPSEIGQPTGPSGGSGQEAGVGSASRKGGDQGKQLSCGEWQDSLRMLAKRLGMYQVRGPILDILMHTMDSGQSVLL